MSSVLKRLRERAEMREAGTTDRRKFWYLKEVRDLGEREVKKEFAPRTQHEVSKSRSKQALDLISNEGMTMRALVRAYRLFVACLSG